MTRRQGRRSLLVQRAEQTQSGDASVREDVHARVGTDGRGGEYEAVVRVGLEAGAREDLGPVAGLAVPYRHRCPARAVALQVRRVDLDRADLGLGDQPVADPVVALVAAAAGFPAVVHLAGAAGL